MYPIFKHDIAAMNSKMGSAPIDISNWTIVSRALEALAETFDKHFTELDDIEGLVDTADDENWGAPDTANRELPLKVAVKLSHLLADIIVSCSSEAQRWGIPLELVLMVVMASKTSEKGPDYWRPEPLIEYFLTHEGEAGNVVFRRSAEGVITYEIRDTGSLAIQPIDTKEN